MTRKPDMLRANELKKLRDRRVSQRTEGSKGIDVLTCARLTILIPLLFCTKEHTIKLDSVVDS